LKPSLQADEVIEGGDLLLIQGHEADLDVLRGFQQLEILHDATQYLGVFEQGGLEMFEATLHPRSGLAGKTVAEVDWRGRQEVELAAIWRGGKPHRYRVSDMTLQFGDALLFVGPRQKLAALGRDPDLIAITPISTPSIDTSKTPIAGGVMLLVIGSVLIGWLPISVAAIAGAAVMVLTRCLSMEQAYRAIDWRAVFLIAGMLPLGQAMQQTGAAELIAHAVMASLGQYGPWPVIAGLYCVTAVATMIVPTAALIVLMAPITLSASAELGISPQSAMMAIAIAASASFMSPIAHPANVIVMGPGGYRFVDYLKLGVPLTAVVFLVVVVFLPIIWPFN
jgi:di/tricarboxylate transporter